MEEPDKNIITVQNDEGKKLILELNWDANLEQWYEAFIIILRRITFVKPEEDILYSHAHDFDDKVKAIKKKAKLEERFIG